MLTVLDLFSGIGGFSLGLERTGGFKTVAFCEIDPFCRRVLAKHWPGVPIHDDVRTLRRPRGFADVVCGGFPCQDLSAAGRGAGITASRSGLWSELCRIIGEVRPRYAIVENVPRLLSGDNGAWMGKVLGDLASVGYDAEWHCIPAAAVGAPHIRDRVWIIANPQHPDADSERPHRARRDVRPIEPRNEQSRYAESLRAVLADAPSEQNRRLQFQRLQSDAGTSREAVAHSDDQRELQPQGRERDERGRPCNCGSDVADAISARLSNDQGGGARMKGSMGTEPLITQVALAEKVMDGALNPTWVEWLMGFPLGWTDLGPSETPSSRRFPKSSVTPSSKQRPV